MDTACPVIDIILPLSESENTDSIRSAAAKKCGVPIEHIIETRTLKHSIDARKKNIKIQLRLEVGINTPLPPEFEYAPKYPKVTASSPRMIIIGCGPAGMFAALRCLELGWKPVILERGKDVSARRFDLAPLMRRGEVNPDSNYCFGEGGAGTFSDGKLYTRAKKRGPVQKIYEILVAHGASRQILIDAHPHIGSNLLPNVVKAMRQTICEHGGEVHFNAKVRHLLRTSHHAICGAITTDGNEYAGNKVILATGHSARDIFQMCVKEGISLEPKAFAVGVRIEHPQPWIDQIQYHLKPGTPRPRLLPAARYQLATKINGRGVHSFCMCPGGFIVPAATENDEVVVNGMSLSRRDSPFANSGLVVGIEPEDIPHFSEVHPCLQGIAFQKQLEIAASQAGGGTQKAPAQMLFDFMKGKHGDAPQKVSYHPGVTAAPLHEILPAFIVSRMRNGLIEFGTSMKGYLNEQAHLIGFETRTSSPVRIPRNPETLEHIHAQGLYPCGEGAGYAGGIVSAALDGIKVAEAACSKTA